jgi:GntR family galactonate operon transcriptional repressor
MKKSLVKQTMERLVDGILGGEYPENMLPPQEMLCARFGVSRTTLREAIIGLASRDMLDVQPKAGMRITSMRKWKIIDGEVTIWRLMARESDPAFLDDLAAFLSWIEPIAAAQAALHACERDRRTIRSAYNALLLAKNASTYMESDIELHAAIMTASGNQILQQMATPVRAAMLTTYAKGPVSMARPGAEFETLAQLIESIEGHDATGAAVAMEALLGSVTAG